MAVDPLVIIIAIILYVPSAIAMIPVIFEIFISKIVLIFLKILFIGVGIWPVFITAIIVTGITIITLPKNIYYHGLVTYR